MILEDFLSLFYWILFFYKVDIVTIKTTKVGFNPYSTGFSSFIPTTMEDEGLKIQMFQSLFYWILFFYYFLLLLMLHIFQCFNPYSTGFSSFIMFDVKVRTKFNKVSILILLDSLLL